MAVAATDISGIVTGRTLPGSCGHDTAYHTPTSSVRRQGNARADQQTCHFHSAAIARASARDGTASVCRAGVRSLRPSPRNTCHSPCRTAASGGDGEASPSVAVWNQGQLKAPLEQCPAGGASQKKLRHAVLLKILVQTVPNTTRGAACRLIACNAWACLLLRHSHAVIPTPGG